MEHQMHDKIPYPIRFQFKHAPSSFTRNFPVTTAIFFLWTVAYVCSATVFGLAYNEKLNEVAGIEHHAIVHGQVWRIFSYSLLHNGWTHFLSNMVFLLFFSPALEHYLKSQLFVAFYVVSASVAGLAITLFSHSTAVGGSGFEYAILGFILLLIIIRPRSISPALKYTSLAVIAFGVIATLQMKIISFSGHVAGILTGVVLAMAYILLAPSKELSVN